MTIKPRVIETEDKLPSTGTTNPQMALLFSQHDNFILTNEEKDAKIRATVERLYFQPQQLLFIAHDKMGG